jgi:hypothetical protein
MLRIYGLQIKLLIPVKLRIKEIDDESLKIHQFLMLSFVFLFLHTVSPVQAQQKTLLQRVQEARVIIPRQIKSGVYYTSQYEKKALELRKCSKMRLFILTAT